MNWKRMESVGGMKTKLKSGGCGTVVWGSSQGITPAAFILMGLDSLGLDQKGFVVFDAGFRRDTSCQFAFVPIPKLSGGIGISALSTHIRVTPIMSNLPNDPRDASLETRVTFPKSWNRDEAG